MIIVIKGLYVVELEDKGRNDTYHVERELLAAQVSSPQNGYKISHAEQTQCKTNVFAQTDSRGLDFSRHASYPVEIRSTHVSAQNLFQSHLTGVNGIVKTRPAILHISNITITALTSTVQLQRSESCPS